MDNIFIDTSIFEENNFLEGKRIKEVYKLSERGDIKVILPKLTYDEIINRISKNVDESYAKFNKYRDDTRILRNIPSLAEKFKSFDNQEEKNTLFDLLKNRFNKSNFVIVDYPTLDIEEIFKSYFEKKFPFSSGAKKNEFPDAFALKSLEIWAESQGIKVLAFSKDNDMLKYESDYLKIIPDFDSYLSEKIIEIEGIKYQKRLAQIEDIIKNHSKNIQDRIKEWTEDQLDDDSKYYEYSNYYEVHDVSIIKVSVDIDDYSITNVSEDYISVELNVSIYYNVIINIDDENYMYKDEDTKEWIFYETTDLEIDEVRNIEVDLIFEIESDDDIVYDPEIEEINGGRKLNI